MPEAQAETQAQAPQATPENSTEESLAHQAALRIIASEEQETKAETQETKVEAQPDAETKVVGEPPAFEWEKVKAFKHKFTVKGEGGVDEEVEVPLEEMQSGYMRYKDYHRKTTELSKARDALTDEVRKAIDPKTKELDEKLQTYDQVLLAAMQDQKNVDLDKLAQEDPAAWAQRVQAINRLGEAINRIRGERAEIARKSLEEQSANLEKVRRSAVEELQRDIPGWSNDLYSKILKTGTEYGFKQEELNAITDPRAIKVLHEAMQFRALQKAKPQVEKRVVETPKPLKAGAANEKPDASAEKWNSGMETLRRNPKDTGAAVRVAKLILERTG